MPVAFTMHDKCSLFILFDMLAICFIDCLNSDIQEQNDFIQANNKSMLYNIFFQNAWKEELLSTISLSMVNAQKSQNLFKYI
jgi:hypothetical protein